MQRAVSFPWLCKSRVEGRLRARIRVAALFRGVDGTAGTAHLCLHGMSAGPVRGIGMARLTISPETVCYIIVKAREFDVKVDPTDPDSGSNPGDDNEVDILE